MSQKDDLLQVAKRVVWFESPESALQQPKRFLAYLMTYGTLEEVLVAKKYFSEADLESVLLDPPPGIFDARSWNYWHVFFKREPVPPLPKRSLANHRLE
ncbi:MAG: hypothetical protein JOZ10_00260 [Acidobacteria bacterium]|nr:hypothetical protein [Acidobacteriota bacterium]MBV9145199.1 hypothetical protein [Acidobacteriota bacterium]